MQIENCYNLLLVELLLLSLGCDPVFKNPSYLIYFNFTYWGGGCVFFISRGSQLSTEKSNYTHWKLMPETQLYFNSLSVLLKLLIPRSQNVLFGQERQGWELLIKKHVLSLLRDSHQHHWERTQFPHPKNKTLWRVNLVKVLRPSQQNNMAVEVRRGRGVEGRGKQWEPQPRRKGLSILIPLILTVVMFHPLLLLYTFQNNYYSYAMTKE